MAKNENPTFVSNVSVEDLQNEIERLTNEKNEIVKKIDILLWGNYSTLWNWDLIKNTIELYGVTTKIDEYNRDFPLQNANHFFERIHKDDIDLLKENITEHLKFKTPFFENEFRVQNTNNNWTWLFLKGKINECNSLGEPVTLHGVVFKIHQKKIAEQLLADERYKFENLFENSPIATWLEDLSGIDYYLENLKNNGITDLKLFFNKHPKQLKEMVKLIRVIDVNQAAIIQNNAQSKEDLIYRMNNSFVEETYNDFIYELESIQKGDNIIEFISHSIKFDGSPLVILLRICIPKKGDKMDLSKVIVTGTDITQSKQVELELIIAKEKAEESDRLKSAFLTNISHEIRTPINGIIGFSEVLKYNQNMNSVQIHYLDSICNQSYKLISIIDDIIDISKLETGNISLNNEITILSDIILIIENRFSKEIKGRNIDFIIENQEINNDFCLKIDSKRLIQILSNLLSNALKFTENGFIKFGFTSSEKEIRFYVEDSGIGINKAQQMVVFESFRQIDYDLTRQYSGTGLGLSIANKLAHLMGGRIELESQFGKGSIFSLILPRKEN